MTGTTSPLSQLDQTVSAAYERVMAAYRQVRTHVYDVCTPDQVRLRRLTRDQLVCLVAFEEAEAELEALRRRRRQALRVPSPRPSTSERRTG
jgi:hypothetical protein